MHNVGINIKKNYTDKNLKLCTIWNKIKRNNEAEQKSIKQKNEADVKRILTEDHIRATFNRQKILEPIKKKDIRYRPDSSNFEERVLAKVAKKNLLKHTITFYYCFKPIDVTFEVDEETFKNAKKGDKGWLCYNYRYNLFYYFDNHGQV